MSTLTRDDVLAHAHPLDDATVAEIIATGANKREYKRACVFYAREKKNHAHSDVPVGRVGDVISILERAGAAVHDSLLGEAGSTLA
jgi:hypothetical protein